MIQYIYGVIDPQIFTVPSNLLLNYCVVPYIRIAIQSATGHHINDNAVSKKGQRGISTTLSIMRKLLRGASASDELHGHPRRKIDHMIPHHSCPKHFAHDRAYSTFRAVLVWYDVIDEDGRVIN